ncbi:hypothetical protein C2G38_2195264 [Gigaspora rosea]|uniref:BTB domain-containing protein n=1 Tax=Gigaspora rosea TaxID=44941 RepID=A0A397V040_9GLOM|nr:hypothetical protein C2G38_2195264 [Gigaspora rosea]
MTTKFFEQLSSNLIELLKNSDKYNVIIEVGQEPNNQAFKVHSIILNSRSLYFKDKLGKITYNNNNVKIIKQPNVSIEVFDIIINEFGLEELIKHIQLFLLENNSSWLRLNFSRVYQASFKNDNLKDLQQFFANIIAKHPNIIFDSDEFLTLSENILIFILKLDNLQMDEGKIWDYVIKRGVAQNLSLPPDIDKWSDEHFLTLKNSLQNCLPLIRYFQISGEDIFDKIRPYQKLLEPALWADIMLKFMAPNRNITITSHVLPPRINLPTTLPSRDSISIAESNKASELRKSGEAYIKIGRYKESLVDLTKSLDIEPNNAFALKNRGVVYYKMKEYDKSLADLDKEIEPDDAFALRCRGETYYWMDKFEESLADLNKSLEIEPNSALTLRLRGNTYRMMKRYEESLADLNKSLEIEPNNAFALRSRGKAYRMMKRYEESLANFNKSLEIEPNNAFALKNRGKTYYLMDKYEESLADLNKSLDIEPNNTDALANRGETYRMMERYEESLADLNKSLEIEPNHAFTLRIRGKTLLLDG